MIVAIKEIKTRKGERMAVLTIEDLEGQAEVVVFPKVHRSCIQLLEADRVLLFRGRPETADDGPRMIASEVCSLEQAARRAAEQSASGLEIAVDLDRAPPGLPAAICEVLERHRGTIPVTVQLERSVPPRFRARIAPHRYLLVDPNAGLVEELEALVGAGQVRLLQ
jgi:DNA polymerase-3 subunit alpha